MCCSRTEQRERFCYTSRKFYFLKTLFTLEHCSPSRCPAVFVAAFKVTFSCKHSQMFLKNINRHSLDEISLVINNFVPLIIIECYFDLFHIPIFFVYFFWVGFGSFKEGAKICSTWLIRVEKKIEIYYHHFVLVELRWYLNYPNHFCEQVRN